MFDKDGEASLERIRADQVHALSCTWFIKAVTVCYQKPELAVERMLRYQQGKGNDALSTKLALEPDFFGSPKTGKQNLIFR